MNNQIYHNGIQMIRCSIIGEMTKSCVRDGALSTCKKCIRTLYIRASYYMPLTGYISDSKLLFFKLYILLLIKKVASLFI